MKKKKVIAFIDWYLPGYKAGGGQRAFANMVSYLRDNFDFYIITRNTDFLENIPYEDINSEQWICRNNGEFVYYCPENKVGRELYKRLIKEIQPDLAYINGVYSWKFSILPLLVLKGIGFKNKKVLGTYGMLAPTAINIKKKKKKLFITLSKLAGLYKNVLFHTTSIKESDDVKNAIGKYVSVQMAPHLPVKELPELKVIKKDRGNLKLISIARISPEKNTLFALERLRDIQEIEGSIIYDLYGPIYNKEYWEKCLKVIKQLPIDIKVNYMGVVDGNKVLDLFTQYHALFMPTRGENFGYVILESFMAGRPVIISDQTPWKGLQQLNAGWNLNLNEDERNLKNWSEVLNDFVKMEQEEFDKCCKAAKFIAKDFIEDPELLEGNVALFN